MQAAPRPGMANIRVDYRAGHGADASADPHLQWALPKRDVAHRIVARQALYRQELAVAERHPRRALDADPESAEARTLMA
jgi:hypothetical protein